MRRRLVRNQRLMNQVRDGQLAGLAELFDRHGNRCLRRATKIHGAADAEDAVFDVFLLLWREPPEHGRRIRGWLLVNVSDRA
jgi:DNA-directed RNA polymerase specialized sigma24 family protein